MRFAVLTVHGYLAIPIEALAHLGNMVILDKHHSKGYDKTAYSYNTQSKPEILLVDAHAIFPDEASAKKFLDGEEPTLQHLAAPPSDEEGPF